jgi:hypothetical protein
MKTLYIRFLLHGGYLGNPKYAFTNVFKIIIIMKTTLQFFSQIPTCIRIYFCNIQMKQLKI